MTDDVFPTDDDQAIVKVEGAPKSTNEPLTRRDLLNFQAVREIIGQKLREGGELAEEYVRSRVAQETNAAAKSAAEAAELAAQKEEKEANADLTRQQAVEKFIENLESISKLESNAQVLAITKLILENPELSEQLERIEEVVSRLKLVHGTLIGPADERLVRPAQKGKIKRLIDDKGFGFIDTGSAGDLFFHHSAVDGASFEELQEGQTVTFDEGKGPKGPRAENVRLV